MSVSNDEVSGVYTFLKSTPEVHLKSMLVDDALTDSHFKLLIKMARSCTEADFISAFESESFGGLRLKAPEIKIQESFWAICKVKFSTLGLLSSTQAA